MIFVKSQEQDFVEPVPKKSINTKNADKILNNKDAVDAANDAEVEDEDVAVAADKAKRQKAAKTKGGKKVKKFNNSDRESVDELVVTAVTSDTLKRSNDETSPSKKRLRSGKKEKLKEIDNNQGQENNNEKNEKQKSRATKNLSQESQDPADVDELEKTKKPKASKKDISKKKKNGIFFLISNPG